MRRLATTLALMLSMSGAAFAEQVFSFDTTPGKLPKNVVPISYAIELKPDMAGLTLSGVENVEIEVREATARIVLNAVGTSFDAVTVDGDAQRADVALPAVDAWIKTRR
jgi:aminopeptidase N